MEWIVEEWSPGKENLRLQGSFWQKWVGKDWGIRGLISISVICYVMGLLIAKLIRYLESKWKINISLFSSVLRDKGYLPFIKDIRLSNFSLLLSPLCQQES